ncbi:MAG: zinc ribbon domain-containing protein [Acidobacteriota bacterium]
MSGGLKLLLDPNLLGLLGSLVPGTKSASSPFRHGIERTPTDQDTSALTALGIIDNAGKVSAEHLPILNLLASTPAFARIGFAGGYGLLEYVNYFSTEGTTSVSFITCNDGLIIDSPSVTDDVLTQIRQYTGSSELLSSEIDIDLPNIEAVVLAALIDLQRRSTLRSIAEDTSVQNEFSMDRIYSCVNSEINNAQWLVTAVKKLTDVKPEWLDVQNALTALQQQGYAKRGTIGFELNDDLQLLAKNLLIIDNALNLRTGREFAEGQVVQAGFVCLQSGVHALLLVENVGDLVHFQSITAALMLEYLRYFLNTPDALQQMAIDMNSKQAQQTTTDIGQSPESVNEVPPVEPASAAASSDVVCSQCSTVLKPGARFCTNCGTSIMDQPPAKLFCHNCGNKLIPGMKFCSNCGADNSK